MIFLTNSKTTHNFYSVGKSLFDSIRGGYAVKLRITFECMFVPIQQIFANTLETGNKVAGNEIQ